MKKILLIICMACITGLSAFSQEKKPAGQPAVKSARYVKKADGTPDMRYRANKEMVKKGAAGPLKKDGTPDRRYKMNKVKKKS